MSEHTPGPWRTYNAIDHRILKRWRVIDSERLLVAEIAERPGGESELANAHIIASAPELLEALVNVWVNIPAGVLEKYGLGAKEIHAIIAKARGEG